MGGVSPDIMDPRPENLKPGVSTNETRGGGTWRPALWKIKQEACSVGCHGFLCLKGSEGRNLSHSHSPPLFFKSQIAPKVCSFQTWIMVHSKKYTLYHSVYI